MDLTRTRTRTRDRPRNLNPRANIPVADLAAYRWLLQYLFADGDPTPPSVPPLDRAAVAPPLARKAERDATP